MRLGAERNIYSMDDKIKEQLELLLKNSEWISKNTLKYFFGGFDNYQDYEKYGDMFQDIKFDPEQKYKSEDYLD